MNNRILFRTDGSQDLGMGHVIRCIALAKYFKQKGLDSLFVTRDYGYKAIELIKDYGFQIEIITGCNSLKEDCFLTMGFASGHNVNLVITDLSNKDFLLDLDAYSSYIKTLKEHVKYVITIDGFGKDSISVKVPVSSDIIIIPYVGAEGKQYKSKGNSKYLLGPSYFIFNEQFVKLAIIERKIKKKAHNILVTVGGSDPFDLTIKIVKVLSKLNRAFLNIRVVLGPGFKDSIRDKLKKLLSGFEGNYELLYDIDNMSELMLWADLAIIGSGLTKYEAAVTGTPAIIISQSPVNNEANREFSKADTALYLGHYKDIERETIREAVERLSAEFLLRKKMSENGKRLSDARGMDRILSEIPEKVLYERKYSNRE